MTKLLAVCVFLVVVCLGGAWLLWDELKRRKFMKQFDAESKRLHL